MSSGQQTLDFTDYSKSVGATLSLPGSWWVGGTPADKAEEWLCEVVQYKPDHRFEGCRYPKEAVLLHVEGVPDGDENEWWCECKGKNERTFGSLLQRHKDRVQGEVERGAAIALIAEVESAGGGGDDDGNSGDDVDDSASAAPVGLRRFKSYVKPFFSVVSGPTACRSSDMGTDGDSAKNVSFLMRCKLPGKGSVKMGEFKQTCKKMENGEYPDGAPTSTGIMIKKLKQFYPDIHKEFV
ncbi:hypothetical protein M885DRAFT_51363 [Pelagophyceae sp. CCMP2097]|nr:hypothetical protein M885DRAFT_51363 [Pelagophyceae sp. CCMP2097]|mmetsp:Transcript_1997/g.6009  ORF Transcript_1997/g.6009 Transcript_1997/m.6009 type:complete len:239 (+) Transcript_1997:82-798(+)